METAQTLSKAILCMCWPPALPRPDECLRCLPMRPLPQCSEPRSLRCFFAAVGCGNENHSVSKLCCALRHQRNATQRENVRPPSHPPQRPCTARTLPHLDCPEPSHQLERTAHARTSSNRRSHYHEQAQAQCRARCSHHHAGGGQPHWLPPREAVANCLAACRQPTASVLTPTRTARPRARCIRADARTDG